MAGYDEFQLDASGAEVAVGQGIAKARWQGKKVAEESYVIGDYEDKLSATVRAYKALLRTILEGEIKNGREKKGAIRTGEKRGSTPNWFGRRS